MNQNWPGGKIIALLLSALFLCISGCQPRVPEADQTPKQVTEYQNQNETPQSGGVLRLALTGTKTLQPILTEQQSNLYVLKLIFDGLFRTGPNHALESVLCDSYSISPDGLTYTFKIKEGVSFHNGARLTAADVDATLAVLLASEGIYKGRLSCIASHSSRDMTLTVTLHRPTVNFPAFLDFPVLSKADLGTAAASYVPNGTGRYKVQSYKQSKELYLSVNENYHEPFAPYISNITVYLLKDTATAVSMLENLQVDLLPSDVINLYEYTPKRNLSSAEFSGGRFTFLGMNNQRPALLSALTRAALAVCINRQALLSDCTIPYAMPADLPLPSASVWNNPQLPELTFDPEHARQLLVDDGWQDTDGDGVLEKDVYGEQTKLSLNILINEDNQTRLKIAAQLKQYFADAGISAAVTAVPFAEYEARIARREYDLFVGGVSLSENFDLSFLLKTDENPCGISSERIDQVLNALVLTEGAAQKQALFYELCDVLKTEVPLTGLYFEYDLLVFDGRLKGNITPSVSDIFYGIENWFLSGS